MAQPSSRARGRENRANKKKWRRGRALLKEGRHPRKRVLLLLRWFVDISFSMENECLFVFLTMTRGMITGYLYVIWISPTKNFPLFQIDVTDIGNCYVIFIIILLLLLLLLFFS